MTDEDVEIKKLQEKLKELYKKKKGKLDLKKINDSQEVKIGTKTNKIKYTVRDNRNRVFLPSEWKKFYDALSENQKPFFTLCINTGARVNEILNIKKGDMFELSSKRILMRVTKVRHVIGEIKPTPRPIKVSTKFAKYLKRIIKEKSKEDYVVKYSQPAAHICLKKTLKKIGIKDYYMFSVHNIRKTLETWLKALGVDETTLEKHFGHDIRTAKNNYLQEDIYTFKEKDEMRDIIDDLAERLKGLKD